MLDQWFVIVNGVSMVEDIRSKPENELSTREGAGEVYSNQSRRIFVH